MFPTEPQEPVKAAVWYCLDNYCYDDAVFLAERLHAEVSSIDTSYLLATCYYRSGRVQQARHHLMKNNLQSDPCCSLLYAQCCLELEDYKSGLVALKGILCLHQVSESELSSRYGNEIGVALKLLGILNMKLNQTKEAVKHFRAALKYNPFLWSVYESLCDMGESFPPEQCFSLSSYPVFLKHHQHNTTHQHRPDTTTQPAQTTQHSHSINTLTQHTPIEHTLEKSKTMSSAFTPVYPEAKQPYFTPDLFAKPSLGKAVASSTPSVPRTIPFTHDPIPFKLSQESGALFLSNGPTHLPTTEDRDAKHTKEGGLRNDRRHLLFSLQGEGTNYERGHLLSSGRPGLGDIRAALDFGSVSGGRSVARGPLSLPSAGTPATPSFGILSVGTSPSEIPGNLSSVGPQQALNFDTITPSPTALPPDYLKMLSSAPKSVKKTKPIQRSPITQHLISSHTDSFPADQFETSPTLNTQGSEFTHPLMHSTTVAASVSSTITNQKKGLVSHDPLRTPPRRQTTPTGNVFRVPAPKSNVSVRRSARLASTRRINDHTSARGKSRSKVATSRRSLDHNFIKPSKVTFDPSLGTSPRGGKQDERMPPSSKAARLATPIATPTTNQPGQSTQSTAMEVDKGMVCDDDMRDGVRGDGGKVVETSEQWLAMMIQQQAVMEQAAMNGLASLMQLLRKLATCYQSLSSYNLGQAISDLQTLPPHHYNTAWVLSQVARAFFAGEKFKKCVSVYSEVHKTDPHRQEGMELYSSALWHLQKDVELSVLAETLHASKQTSPQALCAMSSVMNLYKDHTAAIKFLQRAIQVDPQFVYAHTLLGHEWWLAKDYDKALSSFQEAVTINPRHYNAWYGLAHVHYAQEKYTFAEIYAARALSINRCSSIACTQIALAQFHRSNYPEALKTLDRAISINSTNPIPKFHKAKVLEALGRLEEALQQFDQLSTNWPREPNVYVAKGKILRKLGRVAEAILHFSWARDFGKNEASNQIREEIDQAYHAQAESGNDDADLSSFVLDESNDLSGVLDEGGSDDDSMQS